MTTPPGFWTIVVIVSAIIIATSATLGALGVGANINVPATLVVIGGLLFVALCVVVSVDEYRNVRATTEAGRVAAGLKAIWGTAKFFVGR